MATDDLVCTECGHRQPDGTYCEACGTILGQPPQTAAVPRRCPSCGSQHAEGNYCKVCGAPLDSPLPATYPRLGSRERPSTDRRAGRKRRMLILVGITALLVVIAAIVVAVVTTRSGESVSIAETTTTQPPVVPETLPPIQTPTPLSVQDMTAVATMNNVAPRLLQRLDDLAGLVLRYPNWNQVETTNFSYMVGGQDREGLIAMDAGIVLPTFTVSFEQRYHLAADYAQATGMAMSATSHLRQAVESRDASVFDQGKSELTQAGELLQSLVSTTGELYAYGMRGNIQSGTN